jgi:hypothetical protein
MRQNHNIGENTLPTETHASGALTRWTKQAWLGGSVLIACLTSTSVGMASADVPDVNSAATLRAKYGELRVELSNNQFKLPLYLDSRQTSGDLRGDIHAVVDYPFAMVSTALQGAPHWGDILFLHLNVKYCHASADKQGNRLTIYIGRKYDQPLDAAYRVEFIYIVAAKTPDYLQVVLKAENGPVGTKDYRIMLEAASLNEGQTFIHLSYSYVFGIAARLAAQAYFSTLGSAKVGFTIIGSQPDGQPIYVDDMRAALERNTMRYYLAIEAYLGAFSAPQEEQLEKRLQSWFASTERYPLQLHEETQSEYLDMKHKEYRRQQVER